MGIKNDTLSSNLVTSKMNVLENLISTYCWFSDNNRDVFKEYALLEQHYNLLRILNINHPEFTTPSEIKKLVVDKKSDLTRLIDKLVKLKYVSRKRSELNRRKIEVNITSQGIKVMNSILEKLQQRINSQINLSEDEIMELDHLLGKMNGK